MALNHLHSLYLCLIKTEIFIFVEKSSNNDNLYESKIMFSVTNYDELDISQVF